MADHSPYLALFKRLVDAQPPGQSVDGLAIAQRGAEQLDQLRDRPRLEIVSLSVNGERVDVVARDGELEWRVVFGSADAERVDWLDVYTRPPRFDGVDGGIAVVVNGPSSSGKSSLLREVQSRSALPWVMFDEPFVGVVNIEWLIWRDQAEVLHRGFLDGIGALARAGNYVGVAAGGHPQDWFDRAFSDVPIIRVGLDCDPAELARRESSRIDAPGGLAGASLTIHAGWHYHLRFDTSTDGLCGIAANVLEAVEATRSRSDQSASTQSRSCSLSRGREIR